MSLVGKESDSASRFCPSCGATLSSAADMTASTLAPPRTPRPASRPARSGSRSGTSSASVAQGRFLPGTILADRYRIVVLLGRGGMGEVYRADDLTLDQPVALKFLPEATARDEAALERFHNEVRIARRISHPNVCRIYDIGQADGLHTRRLCCAIGIAPARIVCCRPNISMVPLSTQGSCSPTTHP